GTRRFAAGTVRLATRPPCRDLPAASTRAETGSRIAARAARRYPRRAPNAGPRRKPLRKATTGRAAFASFRAPDVSLDLPALGGHEPARAQVEHRVGVDGRARVAEKGFRVRRTRFLPQALRLDPRAIVLDARVQRRVRPEEERLALLLLAKLLLQVGEELGSLAGVVSGVHDQPQSFVVGFGLQLARVAAHA